jgi:hypothetical protein
MAYEEHVHFNHAYIFHRYVNFIVWTNCAVELHV